MFVHFQLTGFQLSEYMYLCHQAIQYELYEWIGIEDGEVSLALEGCPDAETGGCSHKPILGLLVGNTSRDGREIGFVFLNLRSTYCQSITCQCQTVSVVA